MESDCGDNGKHNEQRQHQQRYDADSVGRHEVMDRKSEAGHACQYCGDEEPFRPTVEAFPGEQSEQHDEAGKNPDKADEGVNYCVDVQYHLFLPFVGLRSDERK